MIRGLRTWHRRWFLLLAVVLPVLLWLALEDRPRVPEHPLPVAAEAPR